MLGRENNWRNPFGDGKAEERIIRIIEKSRARIESRGSSRSE